MSVFNWSAILPEAVEQMGYRCVYVSRLWKEAGKEKEKRQEAMERNQAFLMAQAAN